MSNTEFFKSIYNDISKLTDDLFDLIKERDNWIFDMKNRSIYNDRHRSFSVTYCFTNRYGIIKNLDEKLELIIKKLEDYVIRHKIKVTTESPYNVVMGLLRTCLEKKFESLNWFWPDNIPFPNSNANNCCYGDNYPWCLLINSIDWFKDGKWKKYSHTEELQTGNPEDMEEGKILFMNGELIRSAQRFIYPEKDIVDYSNSEEHFKNQLMETIENLK